MADIVNDYKAEIHGSFVFVIMTSARRYWPELIIPLRLSDLLMQLLTTYKTG